MANERRKNIAALFKDTRTRTILLLTAVITTFAIIFGVSQFVGDSSIGEDSKASVARVPGGIRSIPGSVSPTEQYAKLQAKQNIEKAKRAHKTGESAIPTIIRTEKLGEGQLPKGAGAGEGGLGFSALKRDLTSAGLKKAWFDALRLSNCGVVELKRAIDEGAKAPDLVRYCDCDKLKDTGVALKELKPVCNCKVFRKAGVGAKELKDAGYSARELKDCGYSACELRAAGFTAAELRAAGFTDAELRGAGFTPDEIKGAGGYSDELTDDEIRKAGCGVAALKKLRAAGVSAEKIRRVSGCTAAQLRAAGYTAAELRAAGFSAAELLAAGFSKDDLKGAGFTDAQIKSVTDRDSNFPKNCSVSELKKARANGISVRDIRDKLGCSAAQMKAAGFTAKELKDGGFSAAELRAAGFSAAELRAAGFSAAELIAAGFSPEELRKAGFSAKELIDAGVSAEDLRAAGFSEAALKAAGIKKKVVEKPPEDVIVPVPILPRSPLTKDSRLKQLMEQAALRRSKQKTSVAINQLRAKMQTQAGNLLVEWGPPKQEMVAGEEPKDKDGAAGTAGAGAGKGAVGTGTTTMIKAGDILYAVIDTQLNSDEPGPILGTIVQGPLKGSRIIGSFTRPTDGQRVIINFTTMSIPNVENSIAIQAVAIDINTARTALSSKTDNHYMMRYGALLASSFLEGFGKAFQTSGSTVNVTGFNISATQAKRSLGESAISGLSKVGEKWSQAVAKNVNIPPTVHVNAGTGIGLLFMKDVPDVK